MPSISKEQCLTIFVEIVKLINKMPKGFLVLKKLKTYDGFCDYDNDVLTLDYRKEFISTVVHECIHYLYPEWNENRVLKTEHKIMNSISTEDIICLLKTVVKKLT